MGARVRGAGFAGIGARAGGGRPRCVGAGCKCRRRAQDYGRGTHLTALHMELWPPRGFGRGRPTAMDSQVPWRTHGAQGLGIRYLTPVDSVAPATDNPRPGPRRGFRVIARNIVCQPCNNGWMSDLQTAAKPTLLGMFEGESVTLGPSSQATLMSWCTMNAICNHYASRQEVDESRRDYFYKHRSPPPYTLVVVAHIPQPELDTMHATAGWRDRVSKRPHAYIDVFGIKQLALLMLSGWLPPPAQAVVQAQHVGITLLRRPTSHRQSLGRAALRAPRLSAICTRPYSPRCTTRRESLSGPYYVNGPFFYVVDHREPIRALVDDASIWNPLTREVFDMRSTIRAAVPAAPAV